MHCVGHFINDNKKVNVTTPQTMHYILCFNNPILNVNPKMQARKGLIIYNIINGIVALRKHVNLDHSNILKSLKKKLIILWGKMKDNLPKRDQMFLLTPYLVFLLQKNLLETWCAIKKISRRFYYFNC